MARKLVIAKLDGNSLYSFNARSIEQELYCLAYGSNVFYENGVYHIVGKKAITHFVNSMMEKISEFEPMFKDELSISEIKADKQFLQNLLKLKAE